MMYADISMSKINCNCVFVLRMTRPMNQKRRGLLSNIQPSQMVFFVVVRVSKEVYLMKNHESSDRLSMMWRKQAWPIVFGNKCIQYSIRYLLPITFATYRSLRTFKHTNLTTECTI